MPEGEPQSLKLTTGIVESGAKPGRPRIHPDRKAYKAQKERERRAKAKQNA